VEPRVNISDQAPRDPNLTDYDRACAKVYLRLLDAEAAGASWEEATARLLQVDPGRDRERARLRYETHMARARWLRDGAYAQLLR